MSDGLADDRDRADLYVIDPLSASSADGRLPQPIGRQCRQRLLGSPRRPRSEAGVGSCELRRDRPVSPRFDVATQKSRRKAFRVWISRPTVPPNLPIGIDTETRLPLRQSEGFFGSLLSMLGLGHLGTKGKNSLWVDDGLGMRRAGVGKPLSALSVLKSRGRQRRQGRRLLPSDEVVRATRAYRLGVLPIRPGVSPG